MDKTGVFCFKKTYKMLQFMIIYAIISNISCLYK